MKNFHIKNPKERGQSLVELALSITMLMILLAGTLDLGRAFFTWLAMRDSAQEGATYGSIYPPPAGLTCTPLNPPYPEICRRIYDNFAQVIKTPQSQIDITVSFPDCTNKTIQVDVDYPQFPLAMPFLGMISSTNSIPIHATIKDTILAKNCP
jgi:hypothetical protein